MTIYEALGFGWIVFATGLFTAQVLIAAGVALHCGIRMLILRYKRGSLEEELAIQEQTELRRMKATGR